MVCLTQNIYIMNSPYVKYKIHTDLQLPWSIHHCTDFSRFNCTRCWSHLWKIVGTISGRPPKFVRCFVWFLSLGKTFQLHLLRRIMWTDLQINWKTGQKRESFIFLCICFDNHMVFYCILEHFYFFTFQGMDIIETLNPAAFTEYLKRYNNTICGRHPIGVMLQAIRNLQSRGYRMNFKFLKYAQSSQCLNVADSSVSYASGALVFD